MANETFQAIVGTALVDSRFRRRLLNRAPDALSGIDLTPQESAVIESIRSNTLQGFAGELDQWLVLNGVTR